MKAIQTIIAVGVDGKINVQIPPIPELRAGSHAALLVIEESSSEVQPTHRLKLSKYPIGLQSSEQTFRREELYGDAGR